MSDWVVIPDEYDLPERLSKTVCKRCKSRSEVHPTDRWTDRDEIWWDHEEFVSCPIHGIISHDRDCLSWPEGCPFLLEHMVCTPEG